MQHSHDVWILKLLIRSPQLFQEEPIAAILADWNQKNRPQGPILTEAGKKTFWAEYFKTQEMKKINDHPQIYIQHPGGTMFSKVKKKYDSITCLWWQRLMPLLPQYGCRLFETMSIVFSMGLFIVRRHPLCPYWPLILDCSLQADLPICGI